jgi:hypothetical protein
MAFPVFAPGDVLNASDMNAVGLWKIATGTFTAATSVNVDNVFTADYVNYVLILSYATSSTNNLTLQLRASGTASATNYNLQAISASGTSVQGGRTASQTSFIVGYSTDGAFSSVAQLHIYRPQLAEPTGFFLLGGENFQAYTVPVVRFNSGNHSTAASYDGFGLAVAGGQNTTGAYYLYGVR